MKKIYFAIVACLVLSSCSTLRTATSTNINVDSAVTQYPTIVDLEIGQVSVSKEVKWTFIESVVSKMQISKAQSTIVYDLLKEHGADILLEQRVEKTVVPFGPTTIVISGYPAKFQNFRKPTQKEIDAISAIKGKRDVYVIGDKGQYKLE